MPANANPLFGFALKNIGAVTERDTVNMARNDADGRARVAGPSRSAQAASWALKDLDFKCTRVEALALVECLKAELAATRQKQKEGQLVLRAQLHEANGKAGKLETRLKVTWNH